MARHLFPTGPLSSLAALGLAIFLAISTGCTPDIGDTCSSSQDCPTDLGAVCDTTIPDGYCLIQGCATGDCPSDTACVQFDRNTSFCMATCESDNDCRSGLICRKDHNLEGSPVGYCYGATGETPRDYDLPDPPPLDEDAADIIGAPDATQDAATSDTADDPDDATGADIQDDANQTDAGDQDIGEPDSNSEDTISEDTASDDIAETDADDSDATSSDTRDEADAEDATDSDIQDPDTTESDTSDDAIDPADVQADTDESDID